MRKRIYLFDNLKFLLILLVVVGHFATEFIDTKGFKALFLFIYSFHMPLFIFISGLFYKDKNISKQVFTYLSLGVLLKIVIFIVKTFLQLKPGFDLFTTDGIPWFMFALAAFVFLKHILKDCNKWFVLSMSLILACFAGFDKNIGDFLVLSRIIIYFPFYFVATIIRKEDLVKLASNKKLKIISVFVILLWAFLCLFKLDPFYSLRPLFTGRNPFNDRLAPYGPLCRILCYFITSIVSLALICITPNKKINPITTWGSRTLQVYFWHRPVIYFLIELTNVGALCNNFYLEFVYLFLGVLLTVVLSFKIFSFPVQNILEFGKKK